MRSLKTNQTAAASLLTVIFISLVLSIMVIGFVRIAVRENQAAADSDLTNRAFYAAEAGLEDGVRAVRQYLSGEIEYEDLNADICASPEDYDATLSGASEFDTEYTCLLIDMTPAYYEVALGENETKQLTIKVADFGGGSPPLASVMVIEWHLNDDIDGDGANPPLRAAVNSLPPAASWNNGVDTYPAMLRTYLFSFSDGNLNGAELRDSALMAYLNPATSNDGEINYTSGNPSGTGSLGVYDAECDNTVSSGEYVCRQAIGVNTNGRNHVLRISSLYAGAHIRVHLEDNSGSVVDFEGLQAVIDSTGRAGDVYRRVEKRVDLSTAFGDLLPDYALYSADDICKNQVIYNSGAHVATNCLANQ